MIADGNQTIVRVLDAAGGFMVVNPEWEMEIARYLQRDNETKKKAYLLRR